MCFAGLIPDFWAALLSLRQKQQKRQKEDSVMMLLKENWQMDVKVQHFSNFNIIKMVMLFMNCRVKWMLTSLIKQSIYGKVLAWKFIIIFKDMYMYRQIVCGTVGLCRIEPFKKTDLATVKDTKLKNMFRVFLRSQLNKLVPVDLIYCYGGNY